MGHDRRTPKQEIEPSREVEVMIVSGDRNVYGGPFKQRERKLYSVMEENRINGLLAELVAMLDFKKNGYKIERTGIGSDFIVFKEGERYNQIYVEVKYNGAELSPLQRKQKFLLKKRGESHFVYRVSKEFLDNYKKEHGINTENMNEEMFRRFRQLKKSIYDATMSHRDSKFKTILPWSCPNCEKIANTQAELIENFGLRKMEDGIIRNQSWCKNCR